MKRDKTDPNDIQRLLGEHPDRLLRLPEVLRLVGVSSSTWYRWIELRRAPPPKKFFTGGSSWRYGEIMQFLRSPQEYYYTEDDEEALSK
ncbi:AlpA family phage regulatory protein [Microbulbifer elongatus]|uniref:helix-turn-helix transcriptional regulator n=1 Tax=Microbulbifer elongatus TaxID=86173 RepID=UPI001CFD311B